MAIEVERTIYRLEIDDSQYIQGVESLSNSTKKLSTEQSKANAKLAELQKSQVSYRKQLEETTAVIRANEKETIELSKQLNALKDSEKGTSAEALRLKAALRDIAVNTKEFKVEAGLLKENLTNTTNQLKIQAKEVKAAEAATGGFTKSLGGAFSGLRSIANIIPGIGIGGLVALIAGPLVNAISDWVSSMTKANDSLKALQKATEESFSAGGSAFVEATENVNELRLNVELAKEGFISKEAVVKQYNDTMGKTAGTVKTLDEVEQKLVEHGDAYIQMMLLKAAAHFALESAAKAAFEAEEKSRKKAEEFLTTGEKFVAFTGGLVSAPGAVPTSVQKQAQAQAEASRKAAADREKKAAIQESEDRKNNFAAIAKKFQEDAARIAKDHQFNFLPPPTPAKTAAARKEVVNIYEQELQKLRADIAKLDEKGFTDEAKITKAIEEDFKKRSLAFEKAFKNKQLTQSQLTSLNSYLKDLQNLTLAQNLKTFRDQKAAYLTQIENELSNLQIEENTKRISTIKDRFERERQLIIAETDKTVDTLGAKRDKLIADITKNAAKNGLTTADITPQIEAIKNTYGKLLEDILILKNQKLQQLSFDTFERLSEDARRLLDSGNLGISQGSLQNIKTQTQLFLEGKINYKKYQRELTEIAKFEASERFRLEKLFLEAEIKIREDKLRSDKNLTAEQIKKLEDEIRRLKQQLADAEKNNAIASTKPDKSSPIADTLAEYAKYAAAIGELTNNVISFWQQTNQAEQQALDRSISLQERRVAAAQKIAERGNAQYLKQEEDRLKELEIKRENAARKELAINAALTASQALVAFISAIAQGAKVGGALGAIIDAAAIVGLIASGFAIVKSVQNNQPKLAKGTKYLDRDGHPSGTDTIPIMADEGEAIIPKKTNKAYHPAVAAIYDGTIPPETLNNFVKNYHQIKSVALPNYEGIKHAAELSMNSDGRMVVAITEQNKLIQEQNELQRATIRVLHKMGVNVSLDQNGFAVTQMEVIEQMQRNKKI